MQKLLTLFCVLAALLPAAPALAAMPDAEFLKLCEQGSPAAVAQALKDGANPNAADKDGETALMLAVTSARWRNAESVRLLLEAGADVNFANRWGETALLQAADGNAESVRLLLQFGANVNATSKSGATALLRAAKGNAESVRLLLEAGAAVNAADTQGETALMRAAKGGNPGAVTALLQAGADANAMDSKGYTARLWAEYAALKFRTPIRAANPSFPYRRLAQEREDCAQCVRLLRDRESPQVRRQHFRRNMAFWGDFLTGQGILVLWAWLTVAGYILPFWTLLRCFGLRGKALHLFLWPFMLVMGCALAWFTLHDIFWNQDPQGPVLSTVTLICLNVLLFFLYRSLMRRLRNRHPVRKD